MIAFVALALLLLSVVLLVLVVALRRARQPEVVDRQRMNVEIFRERRAELDAEHAAGRIPDAQHAALLAELELLLVDDVEADATSAVAMRSGSPRAVAFGLSLLVPLLAVGLMLVSGFNRDSRDWLTLQASGDRVAVLPIYIDEAAAQRAGLSLRDAVRLRQSQLDHDAGGDEWFGLGASWLDAGIPILAQQALQNAQRLEPSRSDIALAVIRIDLAMGSKLSPAIRAQLDAMLAAQPDNEQVLLVYGMAAYESGDYAAAIQHWEALLAKLPATNQAVPSLKDGIARARAQQKAAADPAAGLAVRVELSPTMGTPPPNATLFVIVRAAGGPPMPIAAKKLPSTLPATVLITDADQMVPGAPLRERGPLEVRARLSQSGMPMPASGDLESAGAQVTLPLKQRPLRLVIDQRVP